MWWYDKVFFILQILTWDTILLGTSLFQIVKINAIQCQLLSVGHFYFFHVIAKCNIVFDVLVSRIGTCNRCVQFYLIYYQRQLLSAILPWSFLLQRQSFRPSTFSWLKATSWLCFISLIEPIASSALTLLVRRQEGHSACKNRVVGYWRGYLSGARCTLAYGPADATATHCLLLQ